MLERLRHRLAQLGTVVVTVLVATLGLLSVSGAGAGLAHITVTLVRGGVRRQILVDPPATVASVLATADVVPTAGRLLSIGTARVLDEGNAPPQLWLGDHTVHPDEFVADGTTLRVVEAPDEVEGTVDVEGAVPPPPLPDVISELWRPGRPGRGTVARGIRSGEEVTRTTTTPPEPPARMLDKEIALTFDDGPWVTTPAVLAILREKQVHAMFCMVGYTLNPAGVERAKQVVAEGHSICNHTVHHDEHLAKKPQAVIDAEIIGGNELLTSRAGLERPLFYRPPGGSLGPNIIATAKSQGQTVLMWTIDPSDFKKPPSAEIVTRVVSKLRPGAIILLHDGGGDRAQTVAAIGPIIDQARAQGYVFVTPDKVAPVGTPSVAPSPSVPPPPPATIPGQLGAGG
jgi:peptidoglycan/xylan/chitin deacetylase (PgdA/CDA1 family)